MSEEVRGFTPVETIPLPRPLHRFGSAFPLALAETYANAYAPRRGIVLDPLAHPFSAADAAERADRRGVARSPEPLGEWARATVRHAPSADDVLGALARAGESALTGVPHALAMRELYSSRCGTCRAPVIVEAFLWERDAPVPTKKAFRCGVCAREGRALLIEPISAEDEERTRALEPRGLAYWQLAERFGRDADLGQSVAALYTPRNLAALMATLRAIETGLVGSEPRDLMKLCLLEVIVSGSRLNAVAGQGGALRIEKGRARRGHAAQFREVNVWLEYERTVRELAAWLAAYPPSPASRAPFAALDAGPADLVLAQVPVEDQLSAWGHVAAVLCLGEAAGRASDTTEGRISARERTLRVVRQALMDARRASRDEARTVLYVPHADVGAIAACALGGAGAGWQLRSILYQSDALGGSAGAAAIVEFDRHGPALLRDQPSADAATVEAAIRSGVREAIVARGEPIDLERAAAAALQALAARGLLAALALSRAQGVSELETFIDHFRSALADGGRDGIERVGEAGAARYVASGTADQAPLDDRVEWAVWGLLAAAREVDTRTVLRRTYALFRGIETPDREIVERSLASYGVQGEDGRWRLRDADDLARRQAEQTLLAARMVEAGHRLGFKVHVGRDLQRRALPPLLSERGRILADLMTAEERGISLGRYVRGSPDALRFVDCLWYDRASMVFVWQLDWTARLHHSVVALGESVADDERIFRFLAIPEERRSLVISKLTRSQVLADLVRRRGWRFVKWGPLLAFASDPEAGLQGLEPVLGLEPAVEQAGQQLAFKW